MQVTRGDSCVMVSEKGGPVPGNAVLLKRVDLRFFSQRSLAILDRERKGVLLAEPQTGP